VAEDAVAEDAVAEDAMADDQDLLEAVDELRAREYDYLDRDQQVYLDYTGSGLASRSQLRAHQDRLAGELFGNPHSENPPSRASTRRVEDTRRAVLAYLHASPEEYAVVFTANASGACRLVGEAFPFRRGSRLILTADNHNSVNGLREFARARHARTTHVPLRGPDLRIDEAALVDAVVAGRSRHPRLLAYPAQSNFTGVQHPLHWVELGHEYGYDVLLDAAAYLPTNRLRLDVVKPDFVAVSWYKVFGYPTGVGCLVARRDALARLRRPWFSGGTIVAVSVQADWHWMTDDESAFEDGTLNFLSIPDVQVGLAWIESVGIESIQRRVRRLTGTLLEQLRYLRHTNGRPMVRIYGPLDVRQRGGTVALNLLDPNGVPIDERLVATESAAAGISLRTGCFCNPGAGEGALEVTGRQLRGSAGWGLQTVDGYLDAIGLRTGGAVRVSLGIASNRADVERFTGFVERTYRDRPASTQGLVPRLRC
jgi:selenocysteine lyase/cysteine desulfurase